MSCTGASLIMQHPKHENKKVNHERATTANNADNQGTNNTHFEQKNQEHKRHSQSYNISFLAVTV